MKKLKFTGGPPRNNSYDSSPLEDDPLGIIAYIALIMSAIVILGISCLMLRSVFPLIVIPIIAVYYLWSKEYIRWE